MTDASTQTSAADKKFTVLLLKPDTIADNFGQDTVLVHVTAPEVALAQVRAREAASDSDLQHGETRDDVPPEDYHVLAVFEGHLADIQTDQD